ncbi:DoxX family protein [Porphyrobacter sp. ULC335]|jgi:putative oxidoreductase|uniref:DoxX family protein n=1 Tax=Porphyrobacter sp. ULC335 TaxID=2854260 RepID=UPI0022210F42|nr:DoxX family protein [Porphyrobacter sp. ULC335]UYV15708.1 DoxX family protein [Porphyrobacter sp. ULC335]
MTTAAPTPPGRAEPLTLLLLRLATGIFLVYGVWDNITDPARMEEFIGFMTAAGFPAPAFCARLTVFTQLLAGVMLVTGVGVRLAGLIIAVTFVVALVMVHWSQDLRLWWPALSLVVIGLHLMARGGGPLAIDAKLVGTRR